MQLDEGKAYIQLIIEVRENYKNNPRDNGQVRLEWCDRDTDENLCQEINLWTYWQGWKWAERKSEIKFLVLGQDWGCPSETMDGGAIANVRDMNRGIDVMYLDGCNMETRESTTDKNLTYLFEKIGYKGIDKRRYPDLFFTNFNLGYRTGNNSGGMTADLLESDGKYIKELIDILKPKNIICLGELVFNATYKLLLGGNLKYSGYNNLVSNSKGYKYSGTGYEGKIYPVFHPGFYGVNNRNGGLEQHVKDWKKMI